MCRYAWLTWEIFFYAPTMMRSPRFAGWTAIAGAAIGVAITPFMASVWIYEPSVFWRNTSQLTRLVGPTLESWGALSFGAARVVGAGTVISEGFAYEVYGKTFFFVYLLMLPIVRYVHVLQSESALPKWERKTWRILWIALIAAAIGDGVSYWGISLPGLAGEVLWRAGFIVEILAMLVVLGSTTIYGIISMRIRVIPIWVSALLTAVVPIGVGTVISVTNYVPNAVVVPMSIVWALLGGWVLTRHIEPLALAPEPSEPRP
jgi:hypothetical protein